MQKTPDKLFEITDAVATDKAFIVGNMSYAILTAVRKAYNEGIKAAVAECHSIKSASSPSAIGHQIEKLELEIT